MIRRLNPVVVVLLLLLSCIQQKGLSQNCRELQATYIAYESRCTATGSLRVTVTGGSNQYNYKLDGPTSVDYTSSNLITGLQPGSYTLTIRDISTKCTTTISNVVIPGTYIEPRFGLAETDVTCNNGNDGTISVTSTQNGRTPFVYTLVAPSPVGVGTTNSTGAFTGLKPGTYSVQMTDSCGDIQTRTISIQNFTWSITSATVTFSNCQTYTAQINLTDSKGNTNASGTAFNGWLYGVVTQAGDTTWSNTPGFTFNLGDARGVSLVAKDHCGLVQYQTWTNTTIPSVSGNVNISQFTCTGFTATITGQTNLTSPQYCLVDGSGNSVASQPCNTTGVFTNIPYGSYCIKIKNSCYDTTITRCFSQSKPVPSLSATATISNYTCTTFTATATGQTNLTNPQYCIFDASGHHVAGQTCNTTGVFNNLPFGNYTINVVDGCSGATIPVTVNGGKRTRSVGNISIGNTTCSTFTATLGGATNTTNPNYCLLDSVGNQITCNSTGVFPGLNYGSYCIQMTDGCSDTAIKRCIVATKPVPSGGTPKASNLGCTSYTITITGQANIYNGNYCLLDQSKNVIACNTTGVFNNVPYGTYCVQTTDGCTGGIYVNCITTTAPTPSVGSPVVSNQTCSGFTITVPNQQNLFSPTFCLYDSKGNLVGSCNSTGVFNVTGPYGTYTTKTTDGCTNKVFTGTVTAVKPTANVDASITTSSLACSGFTATVTGQVNLSGASYSLKSSAGTVIATNTTGVFTNLSYGAYCIDITSVCKDTTIERCFSQQATAIAATATASPSCTLSATDLAINVTAGTGPYQVTIYDTLYTKLASATFTSTSTSVPSLPSLPTAVKYKVVVTGLCGKPDTLTIAATPSQVTHTYTMTPQCPSSVKANGSDNLVVNASSNLSGLSVSITQENGSPVSIGYSFRSGNTYTFSNLDAATYVLTYTFATCSLPVNDTIVAPVYSFPSLSKSSAYQCDNNSFSVGAAVTGGIGPYTYQIIASNPSSPSVNTSPQSNPIFSINNNTQYNLIRLRAIDACGNAALNDVSVLPLANTIVTASSDCINQPTTLSTDNLPNATYSWYKKTDAKDSVLLSTGSPNYAITKVAVSDTGTYECITTVNAGCLTRVSTFHLDGTCGGTIVLPVNVILQGKSVPSGNQLFWRGSSNSGVTGYEIQRSSGENLPYEPIGSVAVIPGVTDSMYSVTDRSPGDVNLYRLHVLYNGAGDNYSNIIELDTKGAPVVSVYPNPVDKLLNITIQGAANQQYILSLYNIVGQSIFTKVVEDSSVPVIYQRNASLAPGLYILKVLNTVTGTSNTFKLQFK